MPTDIMSQGCNIWHNFQSCKTFWYLTALTLEIVFTLMCNTNKTEGKLNRSFYIVFYKTCTKTLSRYIEISTLISEYARQHLLYNDLYAFS